MSEINIPDKISETITNMIKKGNFFEKIKKIEKLVYGCGLLVVIFGSSIIVNNFYNSKLLIKNNDEQETLEIVIHKQSANLQRLHYKVDKLIEFNTHLLKLLFEQNGSELNNDDTNCLKSTVSSLTCDLIMDMDDNEELDEDSRRVNNYEK
jgi:hypothetical protein